MTEKTSDNTGWRSRILAIVVLILLIAFFLGIRNGTMDGMGILDSVRAWARRCVYFVDANLWDAGAALLAVVMLLYHRRCRPLAWIALGLCGIHVLFEVFSYFILDSAQSKIGTPFHRLDTESNLILAWATLAMLLFLPRLTRLGRNLQVGAAIATAVILAGRSVTYLGILRYDLFILEIIRFLAVIVGVSCVLGVAYCALFRRQLAPHLPPEDSQATIQLTCPRCQTSQLIRADGDQCPNCRLDIFIALKEGRCRQCQYPLRGLTSDKCPECGTPIADAAVGAEKIL